MAGQPNLVLFTKLKYGMDVYHSIIYFCTQFNFLSFCYKSNSYNYIIFDVHEWAILSNLSTKIKVSIFQTEPGKRCPTVAVPFHQD